MWEWQWTPHNSHWVKSHISRTPLSQLYLSLTHLSHIYTYSFSIHIRTDADESACTDHMPPPTRTVQRRLWRESEHIPDILSHQTHDIIHNGSWIHVNTGSHVYEDVKSNARTDNAYSHLRTSHTHYSNEVGRWTNFVIHPSPFSSVSLSLWLLTPWNNRHSFNKVSQ